MKSIEVLRDLQGLDSALDRVRQELEECRAKLGDDGEIIPLREEVDAARAQLKALRGKGKDLDNEIETRTIKRKSDEKKLYDGSIKNPKELGSLSQEVDMEKQQIRALEDQSLLNMEALEGATAAEAAASARLAEVERAWRAEQNDLETSCASLGTQEADLSSRRQAAASQLDDATLRNYDRIRRARGGMAVVPIERGACQGCRVSLSSIIAQRVRSSSEPVTCQSCGRILYVP